MARKKNIYNPTQYVDTDTFIKSYIEPGYAGTIAELQITGIPGIVNVRFTIPNKETRIATLCRKILSGEILIELDEDNNDITLIVDTSNHNEEVVESKEPVIYNQDTLFFVSTNKFMNNSKIIDNQLLKDIKTRKKTTKCDIMSSGKTLSRSISFDIIGDIDDNC